VFDRLNFEYGPVAKQKGLSLRVMKTSTYVCTDATLFERIVRNLLSNAVRYTDRGGVLLGCRRQDGGVRVEVWDTGRGIPPDKHREIFREFAQIEPSSSDPHKGLGLGLAIVERLARLLDHEVHLRSVPGKGAVFSVSVPRGREQDVIANPAVEATTPFDLTGVLILVIDSDPAALQAMEILLGKWNCDVIAAASGEELKSKLAAAARVPNLIISDYRPRGVASLGAGPTLGIIDMLRSEFNAEIPAVLLTGDTGTERSARTQEVAGLPVLHKPLNPARLRTLIANLLRMDDSEKQGRSRRAS
jgi:CheY-like chemotaxis protein/anti-sigma regulatory factor (Ser/Thr protein kinase)